MTITDVPGIEAYGGDNDAKLAEAAADYADMVIFMIQMVNRHLRKQIGLWS